MKQYIVKLQQCVVEVKQYQMRITLGIRKLTRDSLMQSEQFDLIPFVFKLQLLLQP
jgi:hypothetical protein